MRLRPVAVLLTVASVLGACGPGSSAARDPLAGLYEIGGGDASIEIVQALTQAFARKHPGVRFDIDTSLGSDAAVKLTGDGTLDLGMVSRDLKTGEGGLVEPELIGVAGTGIAVNAGNPVRSLTVAQVSDLYAGRAKDWSLVGGEKTAVMPLVREPGSSARATFESVIFGGKAAYGATVLEINGGSQMRQAIAEYRSAIGMIGVSRDDPEAAGVKLLALNGVMPTKTALTDGTYPLRRPLYLVVRRGAAPKPAIASFLEFIRGAEGRAILDAF